MFRANGVEMNITGYSLPKHLPQQPTVKFGWYSPAHHAIDKGAIYRLPDENPEDASWKEYLLSNWLLIESGNDLQDSYYDGPEHFINLAKRGNFDLFEPDVRKPVPRFSLEEIEKQLNPEALQSFERGWIQHPLTPESMDRGDSLYTEILKTYSRIKAKLTEIAEGSKRLNLITSEGTEIDLVTRREHYEELAKNIGKLTHLIGDMFVPFHVSPGTPDWELMPGVKEGMHGFCEGNVVNKKDFTTLVEQARLRTNRIPLTKIDKAHLPFFILDKMQDSFRRLFEIAQIQRSLLADPEVGENKREFKKALKTALKGLLTNQMKNAQEAVSAILYTVWEESGKPIVPGNAVPSGEPEIALPDHPPELE